MESSDEGGVEGGRTLKKSSDLDNLMSEFIRKRVVPASAKKAIWWRLIDTLAAGLIAPEDKGFFGFHLDSFENADRSDVGSATMWKQRSLHDIATASFNNAYLTHKYEFDDTVRESAIHPSAVILPALMAVSESEGHTIPQLLDAFAVGSEVLVRLSWNIGPALNARGYHATGILGSYGVVAGLSRLMRLNHETTLRAISLLCSLVAGIGQYRTGGGDTKALHAGWASRVGVDAVALAAQGMSGPSDSLCGKHGLFATHLDGNLDHQALMNRFRDVDDEAWYMYHTKAKRYPVCHFLQPVIECALSARAVINDTTEIERIDVFLPNDALRTVAEPRSERLDPMQSIPQLSAYLVAATAIIDGNVSLSSFDSSRLSRDTIRHLSERTFCTPISNGRLLVDYPGGVDVLLRSGERVQRHVSQPLPMVTEDIELKFTEACASVGYNSGVLAMKSDSATVADFLATWIQVESSSE